MVVHGNSNMKTIRRKAIFTCLIIGCIMTYAVWIAQVAGVINITGYRTAVEVEQATHDFGKVKAGSKVSHTFVLKNKSGDTINIKKLVSSCACAAAVLSEKQLEPNQETQIEIVLRTAGYMGELKKKCIVLFEQEDLIPVMLEVVADIYSPTANFSVNRLYFEKIVAGTEAVKTISIIEKEYLDERLIIEDVKPSSDIIRINYDNVAGKIRCIVDSNAPIGMFEEKIVVIMNGPDGISNIEIPVAGRIVPAYGVNPERIFLGHFNKSQKRPIKKVLTITNLKDEIPSDLQPVVENENIRMKVESRDKKSLVCSVEFDTLAESGFFKGELIIKANSNSINGNEILRIPYSGFCVNK